MIKNLVLVAIGLLTTIALAKPSSHAKQIEEKIVRLSKAEKPTDRLKSYEKGFPYETRVDRETIKGRAIHWYSDGHAVTVTPHRVNCVYLTNTVDAAVLTVKAQKAAQKAAKKDEKNIDKAIKELEKLKAKSSEALQPLYSEAIRLFEGAM